METGWQGAFRSRDFLGPYEERVVLAQGRTDVNGPHQGGWVHTSEGEDWFLHFQARGAYGRVVHLQPMRWDTEGWPVIGDEGEPVPRHTKPVTPAQPVTAPAVDDDFPGGRPGAQWQWTANQRPGWTTRHGGDGLRLTCVRTAYEHDLRLLPSVLVQRLPAQEFTVDVDLALDSAEPGAKAGLAVVGDAFDWIGLAVAADGTLRLVHRFAEGVAAHERDAAGFPRVALRTGRAARRGDGGGPLPLLRRHRRRVPALGPGLRRHPLALGRCPPGPLRHRTGRDGPRRNGPLHRIPRHRPQPPQKCTRHDPSHPHHQTEKSRR